MSRVCLCLTVVLMLLATTLHAQEDAASLNLKPYVPSDGVFPLYPWDKQPGGWGAVPISIEDAVRGVADCCFTAAGFVSPDQIDACEAVGLRVFVGPLPFSSRTPDDDEIERVVAEATATTKHRDSVIGYFIVDEPGASAFPFLGKIVAAVERHAPGKLAYINLFPSYATTDTVENPNSQLETKSFSEYLERFVREVKPQFISYDDYMVEYSDDMHEPAKAAVYYADLLEIRRVAKKFGLPFWNITGSNRIQGLTAPPSPARFAFQAYTTLAAGGKGLGWFTYFDVGEFAYSPVNSAGKKTTVWIYQRAVNEQTRTLGAVMLPLESTGVFFTEPLPATSVAGMPELAPLPGTLVSSIASSASLRGVISDVPPLMVGEFSSNDGCDYAMIANLSLKYSANVRPTFAKEYQRIETISPMDASASPFPQELGEWLMPGHGTLIKMTP